MFAQVNKLLEKNKNTRAILLDSYVKVNKYCASEGEKPLELLFEMYWKRLKVCSLARQLQSGINYKIVVFQ